MSNTTKNRLIHLCGLAIACWVLSAGLESTGAKAWALVAVGAVALLGNLVGAIKPNTWFRHQL